MRKILVPVDFSENSVNALDYAVRIAKEVSGEITVFNSYPIDVPMGMEYSSGIYMQTLVTEVKLDHELRLKELVAQYAREYYRFSDESIQIEIKVQEGVATDSIVEVAETGNYDLIIMGTQGASGLEEVLLGSITASVIGKTRVPVLAVPEDALFTGIDRVVYATDFDEGDVQAIDAVQDFSDSFDAEITCLHISTEAAMAYAEGQQLDALRRNYFFTPMSKMNFKLIHKEKVERGLQEYLKDNQIDLVAVKPRNRGFIENIFHTSITRKMAFHSTIPVLVAR